MNDTVRKYNREAWDAQVRTGLNQWALPVSAAEVEQARCGAWSVVLTQNVPVPKDWFPPISGIKILGLGCGGGQQGPIFAAAGAYVTILDNSPAQLANDNSVASREGLSICTVEGDMRDLSLFESEYFDLVFHPVSNVFVPEIRPVWREAYRVLKHGGILLAGFMNPLFYLFDRADLERGDLRVSHKLPYSDINTFGVDRLRHEGRPAKFGHTLTDQLAGQMDAGFMLTAMYEDTHTQLSIGNFTATHMATRALKV